MKYPLLLVIAVFFIVAPSCAQMVGTNIFLRGKYVEIGQCNNGAFGACTSAGAVPSGYHPHTLSLSGLAAVCDYGKDGWAVGSPPFMGDYTFNGSPFEGWEIQVGTGRAQAFQNCTGSISTFSGGSLTGANTGYVNTGGAAIGYWTGTAAGGQLLIRKETQVDTDASWVLVKVKLVNTGSSALPNIYYFRSCDPDVDESWSGGSFSSHNRITWQNDSVGRVLVSASGVLPGAYLGLGTKDSRARCCIYSYWSLSGSADLATVWDGTLSPTYGSEWVALGSSVTADYGIGLTFKLGTIAAGDSALFSYAYIYSDSSGLDSAFAPPCSGIPYAGTTSSTLMYACATTPFTLSNNLYLAGIGRQWQSSPDSSSWTNILGANSGNYTVSGIVSTMYYRCVVTCMASGFSDATPGLKIGYAPCCSGTPVPGSITASSTTCSTCALTLNLTGVTPSGGVSRQWKRSVDGVSFTNLPGAVMLPYTFTAAAGAAFYTCQSSCAGSSMYAFSDTISIGYPYAIIGDSVRVIDSICATRFFVKVNGPAPLLRLKTYYGDGLTDSLPLITSGSVSYSSVLHSYAHSGVYSVKHVLYYNGSAQDSVTFTHSFSCRVLPIKFYADTDGDCSKGLSEPWNSIPLLVKVDSAGTPIDTMSATAGLYYKAYGSPGTVYSFSIISSTWDMSCPAIGVVQDTISATEGIYVTKAVGLSCSSVAGFDISAAVVVPVTGKHDQWGRFYLTNHYCTATDATVQVYYSPKYGETLGGIGNPLTFTVTGITANAAAPREIRFQEWAYMSDLVTAGDTVHETIVVTPTGGTDIDLSNNIVIRNDTVKASCDPNYIEVTPATCFPADTQLQYTIHFENTGNDTAHNVYVLDTISNNLDIKSMRLVMASHEMYVSRIQDGGYNILKFDFPGIKLLDSSHHDMCDGALIYTINTKAGISTGASIFNRAGIYFDYNSVVMTNMVGNVKGCPDLTTSTPIEKPRTYLYPNPATDELSIKTPGIYSSFTITNSIGQIILQQSLQSTQATVNVKQLPPGLYIVSLIGDQGREVVKFVKR